MSEMAIAVLKIDRKWQSGSNAITSQARWPSYRQRYEYFSLGATVTLWQLIYVLAVPPLPYEALLSFPCCDDNTGMKKWNKLVNLLTKGWLNISLGTTYELHVSLISPLL